MFDDIMIMDEMQFDENIRDEIAAIEYMVENKQIPVSYPKEMVKNWSMARAMRREKLIEQMGFILISKDWITPLAKWIDNRKCLEIMAGTGAFTYALQQEGVDIIATDDYSWNGVANWNKSKNYWTEIENIDCIAAIEKYNNIDIIIMSWPYMDDTAYRALQKMREINKDCIMITIVEGCGGCTANDDFFESLIEIEDTEFYKSIENFKSWSGIHDHPILIK